MLLSMLLWLLPHVPLKAAESRLPTIGDRSNAIISPEREKTVGTAWLRMLRAQAPTIEDPLLLDYVENLLLRLASNSELKDPNLSLVIVNSSEINAFAVPGGIIGINAGLFLYARNENELAGVLAHELAHLSQRHFARGLENQKANSIAALSALLASVVLMSTVGADAGMAALATTQAAMIDQQLRFSRHNETEADEVGMQTLARSGMAVSGMADFFEQMSKANRFSGETPPDFLLTHPVTENRITTARTRAGRYPPKRSTDSLEFQLMKYRITSRFAKDPSALLKQLEAQRAAHAQRSNSDSLLNEPLDYGLALLYLRLYQFDKAHTLASKLIRERPERLAYRLAEAEIYLAERKFPEGIATLNAAKRLSPDNPAVNTMLAEAQLRAGNPDATIVLLRQVLARHHSSPSLWNLLAESYGKKGDRLGVYQAQSEYLFEHGLLDRAIEQLTFALPLATRNFEATARIQNRIQEMERSRKDLEL
ncbi:Putative Zn-dependent protease, contains TPR repeats [gamma proteobacterium HdN1]|nr:Putative Zn-dependent protease, contains TPR repeats [gamma proteobacterium HdN1]